MSSKKKSNIRVGQEVSYEFAGTVHHAIVMEDRGFIGRHGRRLLRVRLITSPEDQQPDFEIAEEELLEAQNGKKH